MTDLHKESQLPYAILQNLTLGSNGMTPSYFTPVQGCDCFDVENARCNYHVKNLRSCCGREGEKLPKLKSTQKRKPTETMGRMKMNRAGTMDMDKRRRITDQRRPLRRSSAGRVLSRALSSNGCWMNLNALRNHPTRTSTGKLYSANHEDLDLPIDSLEGPSPAFTQSSSMAPSSLPNPDDRRYAKRWKLDSVDNDQSTLSAVKTMMENRRRKSQSSDASPMSTDWGGRDKGGAFREGTVHRIWIRDDVLQYRGSPRDQPLFYRYVSRLQLVNMSHIPIRCAYANLLLRQVGNHPIRWDRFHPGSSPVSHSSRIPAFRIKGLGSHSRIEFPTISSS